MLVNIDEELKERIKKAKEIFEEVVQDRLSEEEFINTMVVFGIDKILEDYEKYILKKTNPLAM